MQVELLKATVDAENKDLFQRVVNATIGVYGIMKTQMSMVVAYAEKGKKEALLKLLLVNISIRLKTLESSRFNFNF